VGAFQANVEPTSAPSGWPLESLAAKMRQYCPLLDPERVNADALAAAVCRTPIYIMLNCNDVS